MAFPNPAVPPYSMQSEFDAPTGAHLDANFAVLAATLNSTLANLELIERDDGVIRNQSVTADSFDSTALALIAGQQNSTALRWTPRGFWLTGTSYAVTDVVETGSPATAYVCAIAHTAGVFATDHAAGKWVVLSAPRTLISADVTSALGYTPVNLAGDTMTGALTLVTGSKIAGTSGMTLSDALMASQDDVFINKGFYANWETTKPAIVYGYAAAVVRTAGSGLQYTVAAQLDAIATNGVSSSTWAQALEAVALAGATGVLIGSESGVINTNPSNTSAKIGYNAVFKNRGDGLTNPGQYAITLQSGSYVNAGQGLGANQYNSNSKAFWVTSIARTATGEFCGWTRGLHFDEYSLDSQTDATYPGSRAYPIAIDLSEIHYYGGSDPVTSYNLEAALALRDFQSIWWNRTPATASSFLNKVRTYFDSNVGRLVITNAGVEKVGFDVVAGQMYLNGTAFVGVSAAGANVFTGVNQFNAGVNFAAGISFSSSTRIFGDFSNATVASRTLVQGFTLNAQTEFSTIPNGASTTAGFSAFNNSAAANCGFMRMSADAGGTSLEAGIIGGGAYLPMRFYTNGAERMRINTTGSLLIGTAGAAVTSALLRVNGLIQCDNSCAIFVHRNAVNQTPIATGTFTQVQLTTKRTDQNTQFNTGTFRWTPTAGTYYIMGNVQYTALNAVARTATLIYKNGAVLFSTNVYGTVANASGAPAGGVDVANGTDYYELFTWHNSGVNETVSGATQDTYLTGARLG